MYNQNRGSYKKITTPTSDTEIRCSEKKGIITITRTGGNFLNGTISVNDIGVQVNLQGKSVVTNNGSPTNGLYPVKFTIPGEAGEERILQLFKRYFEGLRSNENGYPNSRFDSRQIEKLDKESREYKEYMLSERIINASKIIIKNRGFMDPKKEIPQLIFDSFSDENLMRGMKRVDSRISQEDKTNTAANNWCLDIYTAAFFSTVQDSTDYLSDKEFAEIYKDVALEKINLKDAERKLRAANQLKIHINIKEYIKVAFKLGILKEKIWSYRNYEKILPYFEKILVNGLLTSKSLNAFVAADPYIVENKDKPQNVLLRAEHYMEYIKDTSVRKVLKKTLFMDVLCRHSENISGWPSEENIKQTEMRDAFLTLLSRWPKTERMAELLNEAFNIGIPIAMIIEKNIKKPGELEELVDLARLARNSMRKEVTLNQNYKIPDIKLIDGWALADHITFPNVGKDNHNCISDSMFYESEICKGRAHVAYLKDTRSFPKQDELKENNTSDSSGDAYGKGCVCFIVYHDNAWRVSEINAVSNQPAHPYYIQQAEVIARRITEKYPHLFPIVEQEIGEEEEKEKSISNIAKYNADKNRISQEYPISAGSYTYFNIESLKKMIGVEDYFEDKKTNNSELMISRK